MIDFSEDPGYARFDALYGSSLEEFKKILIKKAGNQIERTWPALKQLLYLAYTTKGPNGLSEKMREIEEEQCSEDL